LEVCYPTLYFLTIYYSLALGHIELDNNPAENAIRPFVIGRKNFLFSGSPRGAHASATLYTLIETAKACGREPRAYLGSLFEKLPTTKSPEALRALLPHISKPKTWSYMVNGAEFLTERANLYI